MSLSEEVAELFEEASHHNRSSVDVCLSYPLRYLSKLLPEDFNASDLRQIPYIPKYIDRPKFSSHRQRSLVHSQLAISPARQAAIARYRAKEARWIQYGGVRKAYLATK